MHKIFIEENGIYQIDLTAANKAVGDLHEKYKHIGNVLSDVDFVAETDEDVYLIEYKNTDIPNSDPNSFIVKISTGEIYNLIHKKFYGSLVYALATTRGKRINFYFILECAKADSVIRKRMKNSAKKRLPYKLQNETEIVTNLINEFDVLNIEEWNEKYPHFPLTKVAKEG